MNSNTNLPRLEWSSIGDPPPDNTEVLGYGFRQGHPFMVTCRYTKVKGFELPFGMTGSLQAWTDLPPAPPSWEREGTYVLTYYPELDGPLQTKIFQNPESLYAYLRTEECGISNSTLQAVGQWIDACTHVDVFSTPEWHLTFVPAS